jgi:multicomponent Na+:H+ antiporter subunit F
MSAAHVADAVLVVLALAFALSLVTILRGPTAADRVAAADLSFFVLVGGLALVALRAGRPVLLDVAVVLAVVGFLSTVALSRTIR